MLDTAAFPYEARLVGMHGSLTSAEMLVPVAGRVTRGSVGCLLVAELQYFTGTMDSGKSTLALQTNHNHAARGRVGRIFTSHDRAGDAVVSSRLGLVHDAIEASPDLDFWRYVVDALTHGARIDYLICDEAQFFTPSQIEQLARVVDELQIDVFCFGILTDFRTRALPRVRAARRARRPDARPPGRGAVLVRQAGHPQRPHRERRDGHRG